MRQVDLSSIDQRRRPAPLRRLSRPAVVHGAGAPALAFILAVCVLPAPAVAGPAVRFAFPEQSGCGPNNVEGWQFTTTDSLTVSALGVYDSQGDGLDFSIPVGLYDSGCTLLASVAIPAGTSAALRNGYRYVGITPLVLASGQPFRVAAVMHCDDFTPEFNTLTNVSIEPGLTGVETRRIAFGSSLACPTETSSLFSFAPNFLIGPACGNGVVQANEQCDDGNTADGDCCSATCQYEESGSPCPTDGEACTDDVCDAAGTCKHLAGNAGDVCRPEAGECDVAEHCDGISPACPADEFEPDGTGCTDDGLYCTGEETCQSGTCTSSGDPCTEGTCDEATDQCVTPSPTATATATATPPALATATATPPPTGTMTLSPSGTVTPPTGTVTPPPTHTVTHTAIGTATRTATSISTGSATPTQSGGPTATLAPIDTATATPSPQVSGTPLPTATHTAAPGACAGDCDGNGSVSISELVTGVNIALGSQGIDSCLAFDTSGNGGVEINELIAAVDHALNGCP